MIYHSSDRSTGLSAKSAYRIAFELLFRKETLASRIAAESVGNLFP